EQHTEIQDDGCAEPSPPGARVLGPRDGVAEQPICRGRRENQRDEPEVPTGVEGVTCGEQERDPELSGAGEQPSGGKNDGGAFRVFEGVEGQPGQDTVGGKVVKKILLGRFEGALTGVLVVAALARLHVAWAPLAAYAGVALVGATVGAVAGGPIWAREAKLEALLKSLAGAFVAM